jgi:hypothetical protein
MTVDQEVAVEKAILAFSQIRCALSCISEATRDSRIVDALGLLEDFAGNAGERLSART